MWKHLKAVHPSVDIKDIKRVQIKTRLILDRDLSERAKMMSVMAGTKVFTPTELREAMGLEALTDKEQEEIDDFLQAQVEMQAVGTTVEEVAGDAKNQTDNPTGNQQSKQKRLNDNNSTGDRRGEQR